MKTKYLFGLTILSLMIVSCNYRMEDVDKSIPLGDMTFYANWGESEASKTTVYNENEILWTPGDAINVFYGNLSSGKFTSNTQEAAAYTQFVGSLSIASGTIETGNEAHSFWAIYPYDANNSCDDKSVTLTVAEKQKGANGTFAPKTFPAIAKSSGLDLAFYNVCGGIVFTVTRDDIKSVTLSGINNENIAGTVRTAFVDGLPTVLEVINGVKNITLTAPNNKTFTPGTKYYITSLPVTFSDGYQLAFMNSYGAEGIKTVSVSKTINRSRFLVMNNADDGVTFSGGESETTFIQFADDNVRTKLVAAFDTNGDGNLSLGEAAAVKSASEIKAAFGVSKNYRSFDEFQYFTGITDIPMEMFYSWSVLSSIIIPEGVTSIGDRAFSSCTSLSSIIIPEGVTEIGEKAFYGCTILSSITLSEGLIIISVGAFEGCTKLQHITLPKGVEYIGPYAFKDCISLSSVIIPEGVNYYIGPNAFEGCTSLFSIIIPKGVTGIPYGVFRRCTKLSTITIPEGITWINDEAFYGCSSLSSITVPEGVTSIGKKVFYGCSSLSSITISEGITSIEEQMFYGCTSLSSITIPEGTTSIGEQVFYGCTSLSSITIPEGITSIGECAFMNCSNLPFVTIPEGLTRIEGGVFQNCTSLSSITIPEGVTSIGVGAFYGCTSLSSITIPEGVTSIGANCFRDCSNLSSITIPVGVTSIGQSAFMDCISLSSITIPEGITNLESATFAGCSNLSSFTIPIGITSIGNDCFARCSHLSSITIPEGITSIGRRAFIDCTNFSSITVLSKKVPTAESDNFFNNTAQCPIFVPAESVDAYKSAQYWSEYADRIQAIPE